MANKNRGEAKVKIGRKTYTLRPTFEALSAIEDDLGIGIIELAGRVNNGLVTLSQIIVIVRECIAAKGGEVPSEEEIGKAVTKAGIVNFLEPIANFVVIALEGGTEGNADAAGSG